MSNNCVEQCRVSLLRSVARFSRAVSNICGRVPICVGQCRVFVSRLPMYSTPLIVFITEAHSCSNIVNDRL